MRLWSLHPRYLDTKGLVALWREGLLAQAVLRGETRGYRNHPQLHRFRQSREPVNAVSAYLHAVCDEADLRGFRFQRDRIAVRTRRARLKVSSGQLAYEWHHLLAKLRRRSPKTLADRVAEIEPDAHPMFRIVQGGVEPWEKQTT